MYIGTQTSRSLLKCITSYIIGTRYNIILCTSCINEIIVLGMRVNGE